MLRKLGAWLLAALLVFNSVSFAADDDMARLYDFSAQTGNPILGAEVDGDLDAIINKMNTKVSRGGVNTITGANTHSGNNTFSGSNTFSGATTFSHATTPILTDIIGERTGANGVNIDSLLIKDGYPNIDVEGSDDPSSPANGDLWYDATSGVFQGRAAGSTVTMQTASSAVTARSSNTILGVADRGTTFVFTSTFTQTLTAAATLTAGWYVDLRNDGTGVITIDANSSETTDGRTTINIYPGEGFRLVCDGTNFKTVGRQRGQILITETTASGAASVDFTAGLADTELKGFEITVDDLAPQTDVQALYLRISDDAGSSYEADATDYEYYVVAGDDDIAESSTGAAQILITPAGAGGAIGNAAGEDGGFFRIRTGTLTGTSYPKMFIWSGGYVQGATGTNVIVDGEGRHNGDNAAVTGLRLIMSSGNISGTFRLYGIR